MGLIQICDLGFGDFIERFNLESFFCLIFGLHVLDLPEKAPEAAKPKGREVSTKAPAKVCFCDSYSVLFFRVKDFSRTHVHITFSFQPKKQTLVLNDDDDDDDDDVLELKE